MALVVPSEWSDSGSESSLSPEAFEIAEFPVSRSGDVNRHRYSHPSHVARWIELWRPDVIDLHEEPFSSVTHQMLRGVEHVAPVVAYTAQNVSKRWPPPFAQWERGAFARLCGIYPCSRQAAAVVRGKGYDGIIEVIPLGYDATLVGTAATERPQQLLFVGRLVAEKGVIDCIRILETVRRVIPHARLTVVGEGPEHAHAREFASRLGLDGAVSWKGWLPADQVIAEYQSAAVVLAPSRTTETWVEQFGRMLVEAQACGAVVAGYDSGAIREVAGEAAILVSEGEGLRLAERVVDVMTDRKDWRRRHTLGIEQAARASWPRIAERQLAFYERVLTARSPRPPRRPGPTSRAAAEAEFGSAACLAGGQHRPFALPLLRRPGLHSRLSGRIIDAFLERG